MKTKSFEQFLIEHEKEQERKYPHSYLPFLKNQKADIVELVRKYEDSKDNSKKGEVTWKDIDRKWSESDMVNPTQDEVFTWLDKYYNPPTKKDKQK